MQTLTPPAQNGTEGLQGVQEVAQDLPPLVDGPAEAKWVGVGAFIVIFLLVMILIIRGRVLRPAQRKAAIKSAVFEPAGEDAEITFDDFKALDESTTAPSKAEEFEGDDANAVQPDASGEGDLEEPSLSAERPAEKPKRSPFAGLFSRKPSHDKTDGDEAQEIGALEEGAEDVEPAPNSQEHAPENLAPYDDENDPSDRQQLSAEEAAANLIAARELEEMRAEEDARARAEHEAAYERRRNQAAIEQGLQSIAAMDHAKPSIAPQKLDQAENAFNQLSGALEDRMAGLFEKLDAKIENVSAAAAPLSHGSDQAVISEAHFAEFAELLSEQITALREGASEAIENLTQRIAQLETAPAGAAALSSQIADLNRILGGALNTAPEQGARLSEVLGRALPADCYALSHKLANGKTAAAFITMSAGAAPIVIADQFPVDAFAAYQRQRLGTGGGATAQNNFRNIIRRHISDVVESFIIRGETGDHAFMLIPSEQLFAALHADFGDLMEESRNAGLWMMSPTTLAATLQTVYAEHAAGHQINAGDELLEEIIALRERVSTLENDPAPGDAGPGKNRKPAPLWGNGVPPSSKPLAEAAPAGEGELQAGDTASPAIKPKPALTPEEEAFQRLEREESLSETGDKASPARGDRPHFPLR